MTWFIKAQCWRRSRRTILQTIGSPFVLPDSCIPRAQVAAYQGFITVNWTRVHKFVIKDLDVNRDGHLDASDFRAVMASALAVLSQGMPSVGGFLGGFALGLR